MDPSWETECSHLVSQDLTSSASNFYVLLSNKQISVGCLYFYEIKNESENAN